MANERRQVETAVVAYLGEHQEATWRDLHAAVPNHYSSVDTMRGGIGPLDRLRDLAEARIRGVPDGVTTNSRQQEVIQREGRGVAGMSADAINIVPDSMKGVPWQFGAGSYDEMRGALSLRYDLQARFVDYEQMDDYSELAAALDIFADDATIRDVQRKHCIWATSNDALVRDVVDDLLYRRLDIEADAWSTVRTIAKYGQAVAEIIATKDGVVGLNYLPPASMRKVLDPRGTVLGYVQSLRGDFAGVTADRFAQLMKDRNAAKGPDRDGLVVFAPWEIVWWQMPSKMVRAPYGVSILDAARWAWRRLAMMEDMAVTYRVTRPPARYVIFVDTQDMVPDKAKALLQAVKQEWKKRKVISPETGGVEFRFNALTNDEDIVIPTRGGRDGTRIETLQGPDFNIIDDLEYMRAKMFAALGVPKSYFGAADEQTRANLSQNDVMFARRVMRLQRMYMTGLIQVARLHLALLDIDPDVNQAGLDMTVPSSILEMAQIEAGNARAAHAAGLADFYDRESILVKVFGESPADADAILRAKRGEGLADMRAQGEAQARMAALLPQEGEQPPEVAQEPAATGEDVQHAIRRLAALAERVDKVHYLTERTARDIQALPKNVKRALRRRGA